MVGGPSGEEPSGHAAAHEPPARGERQRALAVNGQPAVGETVERLAVDHAPEAVDLSAETAETKTLYGLDDDRCKDFGAMCLRARRLVERGVRFVQLYCGSGSQWDAHRDIEGNHSRLCARSDRPVAALLKDLKSRGLLDETLVVWGGEFGRTSMNEARGGSKFLGRDHHPQCFTIWMAGAGIQGGVSFGATDELGYQITEGKTTVRDLQATILHLLGLDAWKLTYPYQGLDQKLIGPEGVAEVRREILA